MNISSKQHMINGKAFEYALLTQFEEKLSVMTSILVIKNSCLDVSKDCFNKLTQINQTEFLLYASFAVNILMDLEPRLAHDIGKQDILELSIQKDNTGETGDVRDVLAIRNRQKWEVGVSAKNNNDAIKHPRLSPSIDFGERWLGIRCSDQYFEEINPIFEYLTLLIKESNNEKRWSDLEDYHEIIYLPLLKSFEQELKRIYLVDPIKVPAKLVQFLVGTKDFYKVIKGKKSLKVDAYNFNGTLNQPIFNYLPKYSVGATQLPTKILDIYLKPGSDNTVCVIMDYDWSLSFRIHNASSRIEPSLKFDIRLLNSPKLGFTNTLKIG